MMNAVLMPLIAFGRHTAAHAVLAVLMLSLVACSAAAPAQVSVSGAWVREALATGAPTGAYLVINNGSGSTDSLTSVSSPAAGMVQMHETTTVSGVTGMSPVARIEVPAGSSVTLAPGGLHLMLMNLVAPLKAGATVQLNLVFEHAGKVVVQAEVRAS